VFLLSFGSYGASSLLVALPGGDTVWNIHRDSEKIKPFDGLISWELLAHEAGVGIDFPPAEANQE